MQIGRGVASVGRLVTISGSFKKRIFCAQDSLVRVVRVSRTLAQLVFFPELVAVTIIIERLIFPVSVCDLGDQAASRYSRVAGILVVFVM